MTELADEMCSSGTQMAAVNRCNTGWKPSNTDGIQMAAVNRVSALTLGTESVCWLEKLACSLHFI